MGDVRALKAVFMGTPDFAVPVLSALLDAGHQVVGVYTRRDRAAGRGGRLVASPIKRYSQSKGLRVLQPASLRRPETQDELESLSPDVVVVAAYGLFLPARVLDAPPLGCLNVHPSMLPRYRGSSPVVSAILDGETTTGVTVMRIDEGMDSGPIVAAREADVGPDESAGDLTLRLFEMGASLLTEVLPAWGRGEITARPQNERDVTVTRRITKEDGEIDWRLGAVEIGRQVRAYQPWPGSFTRWRGRLLKLVQARPEPRPDAAPSPGTAVALPNGRLGVATGDGVLAVGRLQLEGRRPVDAIEFTRGRADFVGSALG